jgi:hypothetical protein
MTEKPTVICQVCRVPMTPQPFELDLGPADWRPSDDRLAAILAELFRCRSCGGVTIRPGALHVGISSAA